MANIFRIQSTKPIPKVAEIFRKGGQDFVRFRRRGKMITRPLTEGGRVAGSEVLRSPRVCASCYPTSPRQENEPNSSLAIGL